MTINQTPLPSIKNADHQLKAEQKKFDAIFYGSESPLVLFMGPEMIFETLNEKYQEIYPKRELHGKSFIEAIPELSDSPYPNILKKVYETGEHFVSHEGLARIYNPISGHFEERYFDTTFSRIDYGDGESYRILANPREVTDRVLARKKIEASVRELEEERELRERFVSALTHDLRTPLAIAKVNSQILKRKAEDPETIKLIADRIVTNISRADRMIHDLLDANRIKVGEGIPISFHECRLDLIVEYVVSELQELFGARFEIQNEVGDISGFWDSMAIHRILENLASNAIKYGSSETKVSITLTHDQDWVEFSVHNKGNPITSEEQSYLFNQYRRTESAMSSGQIGWGIGLTLVRGLTEAHRGVVRVESDLERGTTFFIRMPLDARKNAFTL